MDAKGKLVTCKPDVQMPFGIGPRICLEEPIVNGAVLGVCEYDTEVQI